MLITDLLDIKAELLYEYPGTKDNGDSLKQTISLKRKAIEIQPNLDDIWNILSDSEQQ